MWQTFLTAIALVLVIEGVLPFLSPNTWRQAMLHLAERSEKKIRIMGLISLLIGTLIMMLVHSGLL